MPDDLDDAQLPDLEVEARPKHPPHWRVRSFVDSFSTMNGVLGFILFAAASSWALRKPFPLVIAGWCLVMLAWERQKQMRQHEWEASADRDVALYAFEHAVREFALNGPSDEGARRVSAAAMRCMSSGADPDQLDEITQRINSETIRIHKRDDEV